ncbi:MULTISPECIES: ribulose-phosphate 3-epimerase [unclassified Lactococcus]|uniref:ribulose-phosphate 3-epimerase n=1 Tax=unclassified Lactococcus TaxID=2643510 RepID=UPI0011C89009|nr:MULTISPECIES: ribulose-phosphate 3-epimerase [unclassified Lactococcus]MQW23474.1 ribulose-phosphate 3-epimerase [Lactococcus sp. dk101]TXK37867.1 ribulose-phosphate 3-epimerase [Lactococcus sp. dk310]TXK49343.1 ribulose-phosphate 3-epimerase [Lactococcus sp. dk322]
MDYKIAPSILSADFGHFTRDVKRLEQAGAEVVHIDIMDGHFVDNLTFGAGVVAALRPETNLFFDCHMMVEHPEKYITEFAKAGADSMSVHVESTPHLHGTLQQIKNAGMKASVVINPGTSVELIKPVLSMVDMVLVMTVNPGFGGQKFIPETMEKVAELSAIREAKNLNFEIEVDGGITDETISLAKAAGANVFVAGSFVFKGNVEDNIKKLKDQLN